MPKVFGAPFVAPDAVKPEKAFPSPAPSYDEAPTSPIHGGKLTDDMIARSDLDVDTSEGETSDAAGPDNLERQGEGAGVMPRTPSDLDPNAPMEGDAKVTALEFALLKASLETALARLDELEQRTEALETFVKRIAGKFPE